MKNKNKFDAMLDVIEAGDIEGLEQQNARHLSQMKTLLDNHFCQFCNNYYHAYYCSSISLDENHLNRYEGSWGLLHGNVVGIEGGDGGFRQHIILGEWQGADPSKRLHK